MWGQGQVFTKKMRLQGYDTKITKVVLSGEGMMDSALKKAVMSAWEISSFEFCSEAEYQALKTNPSYYFLNYELQPEPDSLATLVNLVFHKGGTDNQQTLDAAFMVARLPVAYLSDGIVPGRNLNFVQAYIEIIQDYTVTYATLGHGSNSQSSFYLKKHRQNKKYYFSGLDLSGDISEGTKKKNFGGNTFEVLEDEKARIYNDRTPNAVVGIAIVPPDKSSRASCYKLMIGADDHQLYFYARHKIKTEQDFGFLPLDISIIARKR